MESIYESLVDPLRPNDAHGISLQLVGTGKNVLELGAASGHVTKALKSLNNTVTAVERDGQYREHLAAIADAVVITDLDWLDLVARLSGNKFDVILAGDVLEHCTQPELILHQFHELLAVGGYIVVSLPNVAHGDVRLSLLTGAFDYRDTGLLDRTHLRFFTRASISDLMNSNNFSIEEMFASTANIGTTEFGPPKAGIPIEAIEYVQQDRDATVYQYVLKASPTIHLEPRSVPEPTAHTDNRRTDQLLAEIGLQQQVISKNNERHQAEARMAEDHVKQLMQEILELEAMIDEREEREKQQQLSLLEARDYAIGASAELGELRFLHEKAQSEVDSLVHQLNVLHSSRTWRIGRFILLPLRSLRKALRVLTS